MPLDDEQLTELAGRLVEVPGVVAVLLGGSRARGDHLAESDFDLGLYYRPPLDVVALGELARAVDGPAAKVTEPGEWGPWVDGGSWIDIGGTAVDWIYRDVDRVHAAWNDARQGQFGFHSQAGHPFGFPDFAYTGEVALGVVLADPTGELTNLHAATAQYPPELGTALVARLWEASFLLEAASKALPRADSTYVAGCLFRVVLLCAHALHGHDRRWLINEKAAVEAAGRLPNAPAEFALRAHGLMGRLGTSAADLETTLDAASELLDDVTEACER